MSSDYLFASPSLLNGLGRIFDPFGTPEPYNWSPSPQAADTLAMAVDWAVVGQDLQNALDSLTAADGNQLSLFVGEDPQQK